MAASMRSRSHIASRPSLNNTAAIQARIFTAKL
jgi:hypothetical protein